MRLGIAQRLYAALAVVMIALLAGAGFVWKISAEARARLEGARHGTVAAVSLADAQSALWELRYGFPQFMLGDEAARAKIVAAEPALRAKIDEALKTYEATPLSADEKQSLAALRAIYGQYMDARPKWFELFGAGKVEEAKEWRAKTTTPFGGGTVKAFKDLIDLQKKIGADAQAASLADIQALQASAFGAAVLLTALCAAIVLWATRSATRPLKDARAAAERIATRDLSHDIPVTGKDEAGQLLGSLQDMQVHLRETVQGIRQATESLSTASVQIAQGNRDLSSRTEQTASSLEETAASMEQMSGVVKQNAENAQQANALAASASEVAEKGGVVMGQVVATMQEISESSRKIADIIGVIDGIAFQTNILALNAAVEAARAGEQGRGFAVVASEVRSLAQRSAGAAREIKELISNSVEKVGSGSVLVEDAGNTMNEIVGRVNKVTELIAEITHATLEQSSGIQQVNQAVASLEQMTQQNAALVEESSAAAESLEGQAGKLRDMVSEFNLSGRGAEPMRARDAVGA